VCAVIGGSLMPGDMLPPLPNDKVLHFGSYFLVALIPAACAARLRTGLVLAALGPVLGGLLEIAQAFVPGRSPELGDAIANSAGALVGAIAGIVIRWAWLSMPRRNET
jgi:VanZ family protein